VLPVEYNRIFGLNIQELFAILAGLISGCWGLPGRFSAAFNKCKEMDEYRMDSDLASLM
jgi:hypothetical protein